MRRRDLLTAAAAVAATPLPGCLSASDGSPEGVVLPPPDNYDALLDADLPYPVHGERLPTVELHDAVRDTEVDTAGFVGERHVLVTFVFTDCSGACPALESSLLHAQARAAEGGYSDDVALVAVTFDPENDTPEVLREHGRDVGVDYDLDNWYFLRPENERRAREVVEGTYGQGYRRNDPDAAMRFDHLPLLLLANSDGYVERAYANEPPSPRRVLDDLEAVVEAYDA